MKLTIVTFILLAAGCVSVPKPQPDVLGEVLASLRLDVDTVEVVVLALQGAGCGPPSITGQSEAEVTVAMERGPDVIFLVFDIRTRTLVHWDWVRHVGQAEPPLHAPLTTAGEEVRGPNGTPVLDATR